MIENIEASNEEKNVILTATDERKNNPIALTIEVFILLCNSGELFGFYISLIFLQQMKILNFRKQEDIALLLGVSLPTFNERRDGLVKLGLINLIRKGKNKHLILNGILSLSRFSIPMEESKQLLWFEKMRKDIIILTPEKAKELELEDQKRMDQLFVDEIVHETKKEVIKEIVEAKKKEEKKFPSEDYAMVLNAFKKYKGVGLLGPEINRAKHAIKQMFLAQRTPKQIVDCMKFFSENIKKEEFKWLQSWTLETVMKKMPEYVAGKLKGARIEDDFNRI